MWLLTGIVLFVVLPGALLLILLWLVWLEHRRDRIPILLYHRLVAKAAVDAGEVPDDEMIWVSYDTTFAEQMNHLQRSDYTTLNMDDYLRIRSGEQPMPPKPVVITFDDGYLSNYTLAYPALRANGQKATIFVAPEPDEHTRNIVAGVDGFLNDEQMREMSDNGVSIQSHTLTHCILTELDDDAIRYELTESRTRLQSVTGKAVEHIAIPRAGEDRRVRRLVSEAGYKTSCGNRKGTSTGLSDLLGLPRIVIERDMGVGSFARALTPRGALMLRIVGGLKRLPVRLFGSSTAARIRRVLYHSPLGPLFETRRLKVILAAVALLYFATSAWFVWWLLA